MACAISRRIVWIHDKTEDVLDGSDFEDGHRAYGA